MIYNFDELSFQILTINRFVHEPGVFTVAARPFSALTIRLSGTGEFELGGSRLSSRPGDIAFIPAGAAYKVKYSASESIVIHMSECNYTSPEITEPYNKSFFISKFKELEEYWRTLHSHNGAKSMIYNIFRHLEEHKSTLSKDSAFLKCISYLDKNFSDSALNISSLCKECFISESGLRRKFHLYCNMSPKQYVSKLRLNKAIELLTTGNHSVKSVSEMCGFSDEKYFSRALKARYGQSPSAFRKKTDF